MGHWNAISEQIRTVRESRGLSLACLGRRAGTSAATVSRYEGGWGRFELYTLRKLAAALGCRLRVQFEPLPLPAATGTEAATLARLGRLFWDRPLRAADLRAHPRWVVERVLEYGDLPDVQALVRSLGREAFIEQARRAKGLSPRTRALWEAVLDGEEDGPCTSARSQPGADSFWTE